MTPRLFAVLLMPLLLAPTVSPARAAGDSVEGGRIAQRWCSTCHLVAPNRRGGDAAPPFVALANNPAKTESYLKNWIANPHPPMPNLLLPLQLVTGLNKQRGGSKARQLLAAKDKLWATYFATFLAARIFTPSLKQKLVKRKEGTHLSARTVAFLLRLPIQHLLRLFCGVHGNFRFHSVNSNQKWLLCQRLRTKDG